jgi:hypothetical protein
MRKLGYTVLLSAIYRQGKLEDTKIKKSLCGIPKEEGEYIVVTLAGGVPQWYPSILASHAAHP